MLCKLLYNNIVDNRQSSASITMDILKINKTQYLHSKKLHGKQNAFLQNENVLALITFTGCDCQSPSNTIYNHIFSFKCYLFFFPTNKKKYFDFYFMCNKLQVIYSAQIYHESFDCGDSTEFPPTFSL